LKKANIMMKKVIRTRRKRMKSKNDLQNKQALRRKNL
jgi:hypothetical protein